MTQRNNDDLAAALAGLHGGDHADDEHGGHAHDEHGGHDDHIGHDADGNHVAPPPPATPAPAARTPTRPAAPGAPVPAARAAAPRPAAPAPARPATPSVNRPAAPARPASPAAARPAAPAPGRPATPARPARPLAPAAAAPARPAAPRRPASPTSPSRVGPAAEAPVASDEPEEYVEAAPQEGQAVFDSQVAGADDQPAVVDDDDAVSVPPPPVEYLAHVAHHAPPGTAAYRPPSFQKLSYRQTIIPLLLTTGVAMIALGASHWFAAEDSRLNLQPAWLFFLLIAVGAITLVFGVVTMLQVRDLLVRQAKANEAKRAGERVGLGGGVVE